MSRNLVLWTMAAASVLTPLESSSIESGVTELWSTEETQHLQNSCSDGTCTVEASSLPIKHPPQNCSYYTQNTASALLVWSVLKTWHILTEHDKAV